MSAAALLLLLAGGVSQEAEPPVFPSRAERVAVDVNVLDKQGNPVRDLRPEEFVLTLDGKPRRIVSVDYVSYDGAPAPAAAGDAISSNAHVRAGRLVLLAVDQESIHQGGGRSVMNAAERLLQRLGSEDRVGLVTFPLPGPQVEPTGDLAKVRSGLKGVVGRGRTSGRRVSLIEALARQDNDSNAWDAATSRECPPADGRNTRDRDACLEEMEGEAFDIAVNARRQADVSVRALSALFESLRAIDGPKTVILISEGLVAEERALLRRLADLAALARVTLFGLRLEPSRADASVARRLNSEDDSQFVKAMGLETLVGMARGTVFDVVGTGEGPFERISRELSGHYLLGIEREAGDADDRPHDVRVTLTRPGLTVRARRVVHFGARDADPQKTLLAVLRSPFLATELPLRATTYAVPDPKTAKPRVLVAAEVPASAQAVPPLSAAFVVLDEGDRVVASGQGGTFTPSPDANGPTLYLVIAPAEASHLRLRLAVRDARGRSGSVEHAFQPGLASAGKLTFGDLILSEPAEPGALRPVFDATSASALRAHLELFASDPARLKETAVRFEVAESDAGPTLFSVKGTLAGEDAARRVAAGDLPVAVLPPGGYVTRAFLSVGGQDYGPARRAFEVATGGHRSLPLLALPVSRPGFAREEVLAAPVVAHFLERVDQIVGHPPASPAVREAWALAREGRLEPALDAIKGNEDSLAASFVRGLGLLARGQPAVAAGQFRRALDLSSELLPAAFYLGACAAAEGKDREAVGAWQTALVTETAPVVYRLLADALVRLDDVEAATGLLREAVAAWPQDEALARRLGLTLAARGDGKEALRLLSASLDRGPADPGALLVALHLLFEAQVSGQAGPEDRERLSRYARAYAAAGGAQKELVALWERHLSGQR